MLPNVILQQLYLTVKSNFLMSTFRELSKPFLGIPLNKVLWHWKTKQLSSCFHPASRNEIEFLAVNLFLMMSRKIRTRHT